MRRIANLLVWLAVVVIGVVSWVRAGNWLLEEAAAGLSISPRELAVDDLAEGESREVLFKVRNRSNRAGRYRIWTSCGCSTPLRTTLRIVPGEVVEVPVVIDTAKSPGSNTVWLHVDGVDGGGKSFATIHFRSTRRSVATPPFAALEAGGVGSVRLCVLERNWSRSGDVSVECSDARLSGDGRPVDDLRRCYEISLKAEPDTPSGVYSAKVTIGGELMDNITIGVRRLERPLMFGVPLSAGAGMRELHFLCCAGWSFRGFGDGCPDDVTFEPVDELDAGTWYKVTFQDGRGVRDVAALIERVGAAEQRVESYQIW